MKHIHIIGIGGTFMGGLAAIAKEAGLSVIQENVTIVRGEWNEKKS